MASDDLLWTLLHCTVGHHHANFHIAHRMFEVLNWYDKSI